MSVIYCLIFVELLLVSWVDVKTKKISNWWLLLNLIFSLGLHFVFPEFYPWELATFVFPIGFLLVGFFLFYLGIMGAGDSKFLASLFFLIPLEYHWPMLEKIIYATILVGFFLVAMKLIKNFEKIKAYTLSYHWQGVRENFQSRFSYAPVILLAWVFLGVGLWK